MQVLALLLLTVIATLAISNATEIEIADQNGNTIIDSGKHENVEEEIDLNSLLNELANKIETILKNNDPHKVPLTDIDVNNKLIRVNGFVDKSSISNASSTNMQIHSIKVNDTYYVDCNVTTRSFNMMGEYDLDLNAAEQVYITGKGDYGISLANTNIMAAIEVTENDTKHLTVKDFHFKYNIDKIQVAISGLFGGGAVGDLVENVFNDLIREILTNYNSLVSKITRKFCESLLKSKIDGLTLINVTNIIQEIIDD